MSERVDVDLGAGRQYAVHIGAGIIDRAADLIGPLAPRPRVTILTEERVADLHLPRLEQALTRENIVHTSLALPPGERTKSWAELQRSVEWLLEQQVERDDIVIAFGGGVIGDLAGFAAAILRRGVRFVQVPTTLLAQVDSSVGGKTGINSSHGKNLVGAFHQPSLVLADISLLGSLPERDFLSGYGEVLKYALLGDAPFFDFLEEHGPALAGGDLALRTEAVRRSVAMKAGIVERDETERGERALLNLGHTFGHALEAATGYSDRLLHGEGVAIGCTLAFATSARLGLCPPDAPGRVEAHLRRMGMKARLDDIRGPLPDADRLVGLMMQDKKVRQGQLRFILVRGIGEAFVAEDVDLAVVRAVLDDALSARAA